jgi:hypothetical protein
MKKQDDPFKPDFDRHLYTIRIEVYPNTNIYRLERGNVEHNPTTQEIVGALEIVKSAYLRDHGAKVQRAFKKKRP